MIAVEEVVINLSIEHKSTLKGSGSLKKMTRNTEEWVREQFLGAARQSPIGLGRHNLIATRWSFSIAVQKRISKYSP